MVKVTMAVRKATRAQTARQLCAALLTFLAVGCSLCSAAPNRNGECGEIRSDQICCGGQVFDRDMDRLCCHIKNYPEGDRAYVLSGRCVQGEAASPYEKCGTDSFDVRYYGCCGGNTIFNRNKDKCCTGSRKASVVSVDASCCNGEGLGPGEMCCHTDYLGHVAINRTDPVHTACCHPLDLLDVHKEKDTIRSFDPSTHYCYDGQVLPIPGLRKKESSSSSSKSQESSSSQSSSSTTQEPVRIHSPINGQMKKTEPYKIPYKTSSKACLAGKKKREGGEKLRCCGMTPYRRSQQTCCEDLLYDLPSRTSVCCYDMAYSKGDPTNPCRSSTCGGRPLDLNSQLCCERNVFDTTSPEQKCCGASLIHPDTHDCCGDMPIRRDQWSCCQDTMPYIPDLMKCHPDSGTVTPRQKQLKTQSIPSKFCNLSLDTWGERWRALIDPKLLKIQGRVESCSIRLRGDTLTIPLSPAVAVVGGEAVSSCLKEKGLKLVIALPNTADCTFTRRKLRKLKSYLRRQTLEIFVKVGKFRCHKGQGVIRLGEGEVALLLRSRKMDSLMEDASLLPS